MQMAEAERRVSVLKEIIIKADNEYYIDDNPSITDSQYDLYMSELKGLERSFPELATPDSPTNHVGAVKKDDRFKKVQHIRPMISLDNSYSADSLRDWYHNACKDLKVNETELYGELKLDGLAISLIYARGLLIRAATRGTDGVGEDITQNVLMMRSIPHKLTTPFPPEELEVRGEVFLTYSNFNQINKKLLADGKKLLKNPRNAAAGTLRNLDPQRTLERQPSFIAYSAFASGGEIDEAETHSEQILKLMDYGFKIQDKFGMCGDIEAIISSIDKFYQIRESLDIPTDGFVVKIDRLQHQEQLGNTSRIPRWAIAAKPESKEVSTKSQRVIEQVSRFGAITPVALIEPVDIDGSTVSRATLFNYEEIERLDLRENDYVFIKKGGDVIPNITGVDLSRREGNHPPILPPKSCPICGSEVIKHETKVAYYCTGALLCEAQAVEKIIHFTSKDCMNILALGDKTIEQLFEAKLIRTPSDLYYLKEHQLITLPKTQQAKADKIVSAINKSRKINLHKFITAIGIPNIGKEKARELANYFKSIDGLRIATKSQITKLRDFSDITAEYVTQFFSNDGISKEIDILLQNISINHEELKDTSLAGKTFIVTGTFSTTERKIIEEKIKSSGGKVSSSPSSKTDYLILGEGGGSKHDKVLALNDSGAKIQVLSEIDAVSMLGL